MTTNFNVSPYYDDYDINNGYLRILFKPGTSVQARELTQMQTILQKQISNLSDHFFKEGSMIIPGQSAVDTKVTYLKIKSRGNTLTYNSATDFIGRFLVGESTGVRALVVHAENSTGEDGDPDTLLVKYVSGGDNAENVEFSDAATFVPTEVLNTVGVSGESDYSCEILGVETSPIGTGSIAFIESGIYYVQGHLVLVNSQKITLDKYGNTPSYKVGLQINEEFVTSNTSTDLLDTAQGTPNYNSPGADRYRINLILSKRDIESSDTSNFIELISIRAGSLEKHVRSTEYSVLEETLARRTYDESGDYTVRPYKISIKEMLDEFNNGGVYSANNFSYQSDVEAKEVSRTRFSDEPNMVDPITGDGLSHTITPTDIEKYPEQDLDSTGTRYYPGKTHDDFISALRSRFAIGIDPGKSYVRGYELETLVTKYVDYRKSRDSVQKNNEYLTTNLGNCIYVSDVCGLPAPNSSIDLVNVHIESDNYYTIKENMSDGGVVPFSKTKLSLNPDDWDDSNSLGIDIVGTARVKYVEHYANTQSNDFEDSTIKPSSNESASAIYKVFLYDIKMNVNPNTNRKYNFSDARSIRTYNETRESNDFTGNILVEYILTEQIGKFTNKNMVYSRFSDQLVRGIVYHSQSNKALVKMLGGGNYVELPTGELNPRLFTTNEIMVEVEYNQLTPPENKLGENVDLNILSNQARVVSKSILFNTDGSSIVDTGSKFVQTVRFIDDESGNSTVDTSYTVQMKFNTTTSSFSGVGQQAEISLGSNSDQIFASHSKKYYFAQKPAQSAESVPELLEILEEKVEFVEDGEGRPTICRIIFPELSSNTNVELFVPVIKTRAVEKKKTLTDTVIIPFAGLTQTGEPTQNAILPYNGETIDTGSDVNWYTQDLYAQNNTGGKFDKFVDPEGNQISLDYVQLENSDIYSISRIYDTCSVNNILYQTDLVGTKKFYTEMTAEDFEFALKMSKEYEETGTIPAGFDSEPVKITDITDRYDVDNGQRPGVYDLGSITLRPAKSSCAGRIAIVYSYFESDTSGDYFSVDSYTHPSSGVSYEQIPSFRNLRLSDVLDFRPRTEYRSRREDFGENTPLGYSKVLPFSSNMPLDSSYVISDYRHYISRKDKLYLNKDGEFSIKEGSSAVNPEFPEDPTDGMVLYKLSTQPYTINSDSVDAEMVDNKRYTMRDIGKLEDRVKKIEYYTSLSLLEKETKDMEITDENGLDRFKNGFIVDSFDGHGIGDVFDPEYYCSIDVENKELRPNVIENQYPMRLNWNETNSTGSAPSNNDGVISLPYTDMEVITQKKSTKTISVNPYSSSDFVGGITLYPHQDYWRDTETNPDISNNFSGIYDNYTTGTKSSLFNETQILSTGVSSKSVGKTLNGSVLNATASNNRQLIKTNIGGLGSTESAGDRLVNSDIIPLIRSRKIFFNVSGLKPSTVVYPFFDGRSVSQYCSPANRIRTSVPNAQQFMDDHSNKIMDNLGSGVVMRNATSTHKVSVYGVQYVDSGTLDFFIRDDLESLGSFNVDDVMFVSDLQDNSEFPVGSFVSVTNFLMGTNNRLKTDDYGNLMGVFEIPNNQAIRFRTGDRIFRLTDSSNNDGNYTTQAEAVYHARGNYNSTSRNSIGVRPSTYDLNGRNSSDIIQNKIDGNTGSINPLAQTIAIGMQGGCFVTSVDLFFSAKDEVKPITLQIKNTNSGYPGKVELGKVTVNSGSVNVSENGTVATRFQFKHPIYLEQDTEYALVLTTDSTEYLTHVAKLGEDSLDNSGRVSKQPNSGVLYKSAGTAWAPELTEDLKFVVYRARFDTSKSCSVFFNEDHTDFAGDIVNKLPLGESSIEIPADPSNGLAFNTDEVKFYLKNHGLIPENKYSTHTKVKISGFNPEARYGGETDQDSWSGDDFNGEHDVVSTTQDSFTIRMPESRIVSPGTYNPSPRDNDFVGVLVNTKYDMLMPFVENIEFPETKITYSYRTTSTASQDSELTVGFKDGYWTRFTPQENIVFDSPRAIFSRQNRLAFNTGTQGYEKFSLLYKMTIQSNRDNLSPMIDSRRVSAILSSNEVNYPIWTTVFDEKGNPTDVSSNYSDFISERNYSGGTVASKYITREIELSQAASSLRILMDVNRPQDVDVDIYYKTKTNDTDDYRKLEYVYVPRPESYDTPSLSYNDFSEYDYDIRDIPEFSSFGIKIIMRSKNSSMVPRIKDLRIIALAN